MRTIVVPKKTLIGFLEQIGKTKKMTLEGEKIVAYLSPREARVLDTLYPGIMDPEDIEKVDLFGDKELRFEVFVNV
jgi:hypothetical protein